ncbi:MAG TPA: PQQ-binding-like beta-propeller repeat protein [Caulobacteraceae bacterium]|nr:PQQ-binding-like beta-propeller repeat protein [Caulobacteraceae bacterium]
MKPPMPMRAILAAWMAVFASAGARADPDWPIRGGDPGATRYSPLSEITPANVDRLQPAWIYHMQPQGAALDAPQAQAGDAPPTPAPQAGAPRLLGWEATPIVVAGTLYVGTPYGRVVALDAQTGAARWSVALPNNDVPAMRGVAYWPGDGATPPQIVVATKLGNLALLDAATGAFDKAFGQNGVLDLKTPEVMRGYLKAQFSYSAPAMVYRNLIITGSRLQEQPTLGPSGDVRAWDARTGRLVWTFHTVPRPGEPGHETWAGDSWRDRSGTNVWNEFTLDAKRGILYMPVGAPTVDRYGGDRKGANLYGDAVVAVRATTGKPIWHFQLVHHDIWDLDVPAAPTLVEVRRKGKTIPALAAINKAGLLFLLDRRTGKPIYRVDEQPAPQSAVRGEASWPTQPVPSTPPPLARQAFHASTDLVTLTPELEQFCRQWIASAKIGDSQPFSPLSDTAPTARFPGSGGGANYGGGAFDPVNGYFVINTEDLGSVEQLAERPDGSWGTTSGPNSWFADEGHKLLCQAPPWGSLYAVNVNTGQIAWRATLGVTDSLPDALKATGRPNVGSPMITAGGLVFIAATDDSRLRAFDVKTGREVWTFMLPASGHGGPISYRGKDGRQYVALIATGGSYLASPIRSDSIMAFRLK